MEINFIAILDSTMKVAKTYLEDNKDSFTSVYSYYQRKGRGRSINRKWVTTKDNKNVLLSTIIRNEDIKIEKHLIPLLTGVSLYCALKQCFDLDTFIKWPNDIILNDKKIAGIICENHKDGVILGIGLNVYEKEFNLDSYKIQPTSLYLENILLDKDCDKQIEKIILLFLEELKSKIINKDFLNILNNRCYKKGEEVTFSFSSADDIDLNKSKEIVGVLNKIENDGSIIINNKSYYSGELLIKTRKKQECNIF